MLRKFMIEREVPGVGTTVGPKSGEAAQTSNKALAQLNGIQWQQSFITMDKTFCIYFAENEDVIREHARISGFPANKITEITDVWDPGTAARNARKG